MDFITQKPFHDKVIFLDIDGVLRNRKAMEGNGVHHPLASPSIYAVDPECVARLKRIVDATGARIVVSSTWRLLHGTKETHRALEACGWRHPPVADTTERRVIGRGKEIENWMIENWINNKDFLSGTYVILDDDSQDIHQTEHLVKTSHEIGLQDEHVEKAIEILGRKK